MCSLRFENNFLTIEGVRFASISKKTPFSKLSFAFVSLALPLLEGSLYNGIFTFPDSSYYPIEMQSLAGFRVMFRNNFLNSLCEITSFFWKSLMKRSSAVTVKFSSESTSH